MVGFLLPVFQTLQILHVKRLSSSNQGDISSCKTSLWATATITVGRDRIYKGSLASYSKAPPRLGWIGIKHQSIRTTLPMPALKTSTKYTSRGQAMAGGQKVDITRISAGGVFKMVWMAPKDFAWVF